MNHVDDETDGCGRSVWQGRQVRLRAFAPADWETYFAWNQDDEQARGVSVVPFPQSAERMRQWAIDESNREMDGDAFRFVIENDEGDVVGDLTTHDCDRRVGSFSYGITIRREYRRKGYAAEAIALVLRYYFHELRYQKVTVHIYSCNEGSIRLHEKLGFRQEGRLRRTVYTNGVFHDELIFGLTEEEFTDGNACNVLTRATDYQQSR